MGFLVFRTFSEQALALASALAAGAIVAMLVDMLIPEVGPPLREIGTHGFIAGVLPNTPENMVRWLREPQAVNPKGAMPDLGVSEGDARDIAAFLSTLR